MDPDNYFVVFNLAKRPYLGWVGASVVPGAMTIVGAVTALKARQLGPRVIGAAIAILLTFMAVVNVASWQQYKRLRGDFVEGRVSVLEGPVEDFGLSPTDPKNADAFRIGSQSFEINAAIGTSAYNLSHSNGGPDLTGRCVRLMYNDRREILWLGIRRYGCERLEILRPPAPEPEGLWDP